MVQAAQDVHQRGLARARGAHQGHHLASTNGERDAPQHRDFHFAQVVRLADVFKPDQFHVGNSREATLVPEAVCCPWEVWARTDCSSFLHRGGVSLRPPRLPCLARPTTTCIPSLHAAAADLGHRSIAGAGRNLTGRTRPPIGLNPEAAAVLGARGLAGGSRLACRRVDLRRLRLPTQRRIGRQQYMGPLVHLKLDVRRQIRQQLAVGIVGRHDDRVRDDVLRHRGVHADLRHFAAKRCARMGIDRESRRHVHVDAADVGLVDRGPHLHPPQVLGDEEQTGGVETGDDRLADVHAAIEDRCPGPAT